LCTVSQLNNNKQLSFNGLLSKTTQVGQSHKDKPFWIFWSKDGGMAVASAGPYASHLHLTPDSHASTSSLLWARLGPNNKRELRLRH